MRKIICFLFGHLAYTYNSGTGDSPEQSWACAYCRKDLSIGDEFWGLNINNKITRFLSKLNKKDTTNNLPF